MAYCYHCMNKISNETLRFCSECGKKYNEHFAQSYELPPGTIIGNGRYLVGKSIGSGGFGITYVGRDLNVNKKVLVKETFYNGIFQRNCYDTSRGNPLEVTYQTNISFDKIMDKTKKECESISSAEGLDNIVKVYDCFFENNTSYIITEFISGTTLTKQVEKSGKYSWSDLYDKIKPLMLSLAELHKLGILHRDIKPDNIMLKSAAHIGERFVLIDFGLARSISTQTTATTGLAFSPGFSPFEQRTLSGKDGAFIDVYALTATIYFALTGKIPNQGIDNNVDNNFPELRFLSANYGVPENVAEAMRDALNTNYKLRTQTINELIDSFEDENYKSKSPVSGKVDLSKNDFSDNNIGNTDRQSSGNTFSTETRFANSDYDSDNIFPNSTADERFSNHQTVTGGNTANNYFVNGNPNGVSNLQGMPASNGFAGQNGITGNTFQSVPANNGYPIQNGMPGNTFQSVPTNNVYPTQNGMPGNTFQNVPANNGYPTQNGMLGNTFQSVPMNNGYPTQNGMPGNTFQNVPANNGYPAPYMNAESKKHSVIKSVGLVGLGALVVFVLLVIIGGIIDEPEVESNDNVTSSAVSSEVESSEVESSEVESSDEEEFTFVGMTEEEAISSADSQNFTIENIFYDYDNYNDEGYVYLESMHDDNETVDLFVSLGSKPYNEEDLKSEKSDYDYKGVELKLSDYFFLSADNFKDEDKYFNVMDLSCDDFIHFIALDFRVDEWTKGKLEENNKSSDLLIDYTGIESYERKKIDGYNAIVYTYKAKDKNGYSFTQTNYVIMFDDDSVEICFRDYSGKYTKYFEEMASSISVSDERKKSDSIVYDYVGMKKDDAINAAKKAGKTIEYLYCEYDSLFEKDYITDEFYSAYNSKSLFLTYSTGEETKPVDEAKNNSSTVKYSGVEIELSDIFRLVSTNYQSNNKNYICSDEGCSNDMVSFYKYDSRVDYWTKISLDEDLSSLSNFSGCKDFKNTKIAGKDAIQFSYTAEDIYGTYTETCYVILFSDYSVEIDFIDYSGEYTNLMEEAAQSIKISN